MTSENIKEERLSAKFDLLKAEKGITKAEFARLYKFPGGASMISQNISGHRPISLDGAISYVNGLGCPLDEISPTLAATLKSLLYVDQGREQAPTNHHMVSEERAPWHTPKTPISLSESLRSIAEELMPLDTTARRRASMLLADLAEDPAQHNSLSELLQKVIESGKRKQA